MKKLFFTLLFTISFLNAAQVASETQISSKNQGSLETSKTTYPSEPRCVKMKLGVVVCFPK